MNAIHIAAMGEVNKDVMAIIETAVWQTFGYETVVRPSLPEPEYARDPVRGQYSSVAILRTLVQSHTPTTFRLLAITRHDLFIPMLSFVFGQAQVSGPVAVMSIARLRQEFYGLPQNQALLLSRTAKEAVHELGHTFGLIHCPDISCPMSLANSVRHVDAKSADLCSNCSLILEENIKRLCTSTVQRSKT